MAQLVVIEGKAIGSVVPLALRNRIGQSPELEVPLSDSNVRSCHAVIAFHNGGYRLTPEPDSPVRVNGRPAGATTLRHGDIISLGSTSLLFSDEEGGVREEVPKELITTVESRVRHYANPEDALEAIKRSERLSQHIETLYRFGASAISTLQMPALLEIVIDTVVPLFRPDRIFIFLRDEQQKLQIAGQRISDHGRLKGFVQVSQTILNETVQKREAFLTKDAASESGFDQARSIVEQNIHAAMCVPLVKGDKILGVIYVDTLTSSTTYSREDLQLLNAVATQAALAIENVLHYDRQLEYSRKLVSLGESSRKISSYLSRDVILRESIANVTRIFNSTKSSLLLFDPREEVLRIAWSSHIPQAEWESIRVSPSDPLCGEVFTENRPMLVTDSTSIPGTGKYPFGTNSFVIVPILSRPDGLQSVARPVGIITVADRADQKLFNSDDLEFLTVLASQIGIALNNARLFERATIDALTRVFTRSYFFALIEEETAFLRKKGDPVCVAMLDIDHFKKKNDTYGHDMGDRVLTQLGRLLQEKLAPCGYVGRYGGEEFVVFLRNLSLERSQLILNEFRDKVSSHPFGTAEQPVPTTISIGVARLAGEESLDALVKRADTALYQAKTGGRNRVVALTADQAPPPPPQRPGVSAPKA